MLVAIVENVYDCAEDVIDIPDAAYDALAREANECGFQLRDYEVPRITQIGSVEALRVHLGRCALCGLHPPQEAVPPLGWCQCDQAAAAGHIR